MVKGTRNGQRYGDCIAPSARDQDRLGFDPKVIQDRNKNDGFGFAIAVFLGPSGRNILRQIVPAIQPVEQIANILLHKFQRGNSAFKVG